MNDKIIKIYSKLHNIEMCYIICNNFNYKHIKNLIYNIL